MKRICIPFYSDNNDIPRASHFKDADADGGNGDAAVNDCDLDGGDEKMYILTKWLMIHTSDLMMIIR